MKAQMRVVILMLLIASGIFVLAQEKSNKCGTWRWDVKTLTDKDGTGLLSAKPIPSSIDQLVKEKPPKNLKDDDLSDGKLPRYPTENQVVEITAYVITFGDKDKDHDRDLHLTLKSPSSVNTMIGEIPDPTCQVFDNSPALRELFKQVRIDANKVKDALKKSKKSVKVKITGVPFWDGAEEKRQKGVSKYNREIHPILKIEIIK